jgi:hypothetical protein
MEMAQMNPYSRYYVKDPIRMADLVRLEAHDIRVADLERGRIALSYVRCDLPAIAALRWIAAYSLLVTPDDGGYVEDLTWTPTAEDRTRLEEALMRDLGKDHAWLKESIERGLTATIEADGGLEVRILPTLKAIEREFDTEVGNEFFIEAVWSDRR